MKASAHLKFLFLLVASSLLAACGGGGSSDSDSGFTPPGLRVSATPTSLTVQSGSSADITVRVTQSSGAPIADGTVVNASVSPASNGTIVGVSGSGETGGPQTSTVGGNANFRFQAAGPGGSATVTFSVPDPNAGNRMITATVSVNVTPAPQQPDTTLRVVVEPQLTVVPVQGVMDIVVRVRRPDGTPAPDGTIVNGIASPASAGSVVGLPGGDSSSAATVGGIANFRFLAGNAPRSAELTFSVTDEQNDKVVTGSATVQVAGVDESRLKLEATTRTLPINAFNVAPFYGSPFMSEVTVTVNTASGQPVNQPDGIQVSINPVGNTGGFTTLDDPETECEDDDLPEECNEFFIRLGQGPVDVVAGKATLFVHSLNFSGTTTLTVTTQDPETGQSIAATMVFNIVSSISTLPSSVIVSPIVEPLYAQGSGGNTSAQVQIVVLDGIGQTVPNPEAGNNSFNNIRVELVGEAATAGARVSGINAQGENVQGTQIALRTVNGIGGALITSGSQTGSAIIRVTADRADNNVDNGISDPVSAQRSVFVSDGVLFDLEITQPTTNALLVNPVDGGVSSNDPSVPPNPDGTYSVTVSAIATDRLGNPVLPGSTINFGLIDGPQASGLGDFRVRGNTGNPQEGGTTFTDPNGSFTSAGVGPGDVLAILSEDDPQNRDLEGIRVIQSVQNAGSLTVQRRFNRNDLSGSIYDAGNALDYVIGRAEDGNIQASAVTNAFGVARTLMTYPVSKLGKVALIWAQGDGAIVNGQPRTVSDVEYTRFPGVAPGFTTASPTAIPANTTVNVTVCVADTLGAPLYGIPVSFAFQNMDGGQGSVDGVPVSGQVGNLTDASGCTVAAVTSIGLSSVTGGDNPPTVVFSAIGEPVAVELQVGNLILIASPPSFIGGGGITVLRLVDTGGLRVPGAQITGTCVGQNGAFLTTEPASPSEGVTDANGEAPFVIQEIELNQINGFGTGICTYFAQGGTSNPPIEARTPSVDVFLRGVDLCDRLVSPPIPGCTDRETLTVNITGIGEGTVVSTPQGIACTYAGAAIPCEADFAPGADVQLLVTASAGSQVLGFSGECVLSGGSPTPPAAQITLTTNMSDDKVCSVEFGP
ncbi:MAG: hypothetical protein WCZ65_03440 [Lysobacteraceae bacterium]